VDTSVPWWEASKAEVGERVVARANQILDDLSGRYDNFKRAYRLYGADPDSEGMSLADVLRASALRRNIVAEAVESLASELTQAGTLVSITGTAADFDERQKAEYWDWYSEAAYVRHRLPLLHYQLVLDAIIAGIGIGVIADTDDGPKPERVHPCDLLLDDGGCSTVEPPELGRRLRVSRHLLMQRFPKLADDIKAVPRSEHSRGREVIEVFEFWFSAGEGKKGRHVQAVKGLEKALVDEPWEGRPPSFYVRIVPDTRTMVGPSLALRAESLQLEHDRISAVLQDGGTYQVPRLVVRRGTCELSHLENEPSTAIEVDGLPAQEVYQLLAAAAHPEVYKRLDDLEQAIFRAMQANQMFSSGELPAGIRSGSGKAIKHYRENRSKRHLPAERERDWMAVQLIDELMRGEQRAAASGSHQVQIQVSGVLKQIPISEMLLDRDKIQLRAAPTSDLPLDKAVRVEMLAELVKDGIIPPEEFYAKSQVVDFKDAERRVTSPTRLAEMYCGAILRDGKSRQPPKHVPYDTWLSIALERLCLAELDFHDLEGASAQRAEVKLKALRQFTDELAARIQEAQAPTPMVAPSPDAAIPGPGPAMPPMPPPPNGAGPMGPPMPPDMAPPMPPVN